MTIQAIAPETVALGDASGLTALWSAWQANAQGVAALAEQRGWDVGDMRQAPGMAEAELQALEASLGNALPAQLRWALGQAQSWACCWVADEESPGPSSAQGVNQIWQGDARLAERLRFWRKLHESLNSDLPPDEFERERAFWAGHVPFCELERGDLLTIDVRQSDPRQQVVRFYGPHEQVLAPDFLSFISRWSALGFEDDVEWFICEGGIALQDEPATEYRNWLMGPHSGT